MAIVHIYFINIQIQIGNRKTTRLQKIIIGVNLLLLILYTFSSYVQRAQHLEILGHAMTIACHIIALLVGGIISLIFKEKDIAKGFWLSLGIVLLIGFGTCVIIHN